MKMYVVCTHFMLLIRVKKTTTFNAKLLLQAIHSDSDTDSINFPVSRYILRGKNKYTGNYFFKCHRNFTYVHKLLISYLGIICNNFQEILSKSKEMAFTEMNKGSKSTFAYE